MKRNITILPFRTGAWRALLLAISSTLYLSFQTLHAQVLTTYTFSSTSGTYSSVTGGTLLGAAGNDDNVYLDPAVTAGVTTAAPIGPGFNIGFNFDLNGVTYDRVAISTNGWIALGQSSLTPSVNMSNISNISSSYDVMTTGFSTSPTQPDVLKNRILGCNSDLQMNGSSSMRIETIGTAPSRTCVIQWEGMQKFTTGATVDNFNFQIRLNETTNTIQYVYGSFVADPVNIPSFEGMLLGNDFISRTSPSSWTSTVASVNKYDAITLNNSVFPPTGLTYTWTPTPRSYQSSVVTTPTTLAVSPGTTNKEVAKLKIVVTGIQPPLNVTSLDISTNGTTSLADISNLNVYYTGSNPVFSTATQFGSTVFTPTATNTVTGSTGLITGNNYFWVTYDITPPAILSNVIDAEITTVSVGGTPYTPSVTAPAGTRPIMTPTISTVVTTPAKKMGETIATIGGNIIFDGGDNVSVSGVVYSTTPNPIIGDPGVVDSTTTPVIANGTFSFNITGLTTNTVYYYRAYATNSIGIAYSVQDSFNTDPIITSVPYSQNFETTANTGWKSAAVTGAANDWQLGTPSKFQLNAAFSGTNAWATGLSNSYTDGANSALTSPKFDFSTTVGEPVLRFRHNFSIGDPYYDGYVVEISIAGGPWSRLDALGGTGTNFNTPTSQAWYNRDGTNFYGPLGAPCFSDNSGAYSSSSGNWVQSRAFLTGATGQSDVRFRFRFQSDPGGNGEGVSIDDIEVLPPTAPFVDNGISANITLTQATLKGDITSNGFSTVTASGVIVSTSAGSLRGDPGVMNFPTSPVATDGPFSVNVTGLTLSTLYYYRAYAENIVGITYGPDSSFTTLSTAIAPTIYTIPTTDLTDSSATIGGDIASDGGDPVGMSGVVFGTAPNPAIGDPGVVDLITAGITSGTFDFDLSGLTNGTKYYFRAYAINGIATAYSALDSFNTAPVVSTFPYSENFDLTGGNTGWGSEGLAGTNDWMLGSPLKGTLNGTFSGANAWVTQLTGIYSDGSNSALNSPRFDFTSVTAADPILRFKHKFQTSWQYDGGVIEMSISNGPWVPLDNTLASWPDYQTTNSFGWYNNFAPPFFVNPYIASNLFSNSSYSYPNNSNGWIESRTILSGAAGQSNVKVRMRFGTSTGFVSGSDGWEIDNIEIFEPSLPSINTDAVSNLTSTNVKLAGNIISNGFAQITASGIVVSTSPTPLRGTPGVTDSTTNGVFVGPGVFELNVSGLTPATTYYYRAYAENAVGVAYGADQTFTTSAAATIPTVQFTGVSNLGYAFADLNANIIMDGGDLITTSGIIYSTTPNPMLGDPGVVDSTTNPVVVWGNDTKYSFPILELTASTQYYVKAYAINSVGTAYSSQYTFTTDAEIMSTGTSANVTINYAKLFGNIRPIFSSGDNGTITSSGILLSLTADPHRGDPGVVDSVTNPLVNIGTYGLGFGNLGLGTTYFYRSYAINPYGTFYGPDSSFTTKLVAVAPTLSSHLIYAGYTATSAQIETEIVSDGGDAIFSSGIVYGTIPGPVLSDPNYTDMPTSPIVTTGFFTSNLSGLSANTKYYFRSYAINGIGTTYSVEDSFSTDTIIISSFPYMQDFEGSQNMGWKTAAGPGATNDWELGTPTKATMNAAYSGSNAWVTKLATNHSFTSNSLLTSPRFDFSAQTTDPILRFMHRFQTFGSIDGAVVEMSINNGPWFPIDNSLGSWPNYNTNNSLSWYNNSPPPSFWNPFILSNMFSGYSSNYMNSVNGWIESVATLPGAAGQSDVKVRMNFASANVTFFGTNEGWEIDDVEVFVINPPTVQASSVAVSGLTNTTANVSWTNGNGAGRIVVARPTGSPAVDPTNNIMYQASSSFSFGSATGPDNFVVYNGTGTSVTVSNLALATNYTFTVYEYNGSDMFVKFAVPGASNNGTTLPVKFTSFDATKKADDVLVTWSTASETNNNGFEIERSADGFTFGHAGFVKGALNSTTPQKYTYTDANAFAKTGSNVLYYRLKQVDMDGKYTYSNIKRVSNQLEKSAITVYPNPFNNTYSVSFDAANAGNVTVKMVDLQGRIVSEHSAKVIGGANKLILDNLGTLQGGIYFAKITIDGQTQVLKLVKN
jgi:hypothetical protein